MSPRRFSTVAALGAIAFLACKLPSQGASDTPDAAASPQASAEPAPLAVTPTTTASAMPALSPEGGPPPTPLRSDTPLPSDALGRDVAGYTLSAVFRQSELMGPPRAGEVNTSGIDAARKKTELRMAVDLGASRMRVALVGNGYVVPPETELRARADRYGHVVLWPGGGSYRPIAPGGLRALLGERRFDVAPVAHAVVASTDETGKRIGVRTRMVEVTTRVAKATFEVGRLPDLGESGTLLCRMLLDLMNAPPGAPACGYDELPVRAELRWTSKGSFTFELTGVLKKADVSAAALLVPPPNATFTPGTLPAVVAMLPPADLAAFRVGPIDVPPNPIGAGLVVANATDEMRVLVLDGVPVVAVAPGAKETVRGLLRGKYVAQWRSFLGDVVDPGATQVVPGLAQVGGSDAGVK